MPQRMRCTSYTEQRPALPVQREDVCLEQKEEIDPTFVPLRYAGVVPDL